MAYLPKCISHSPHVRAECPQAKFGLQLCSVWPALFKFSKHVLPTCKMKRSEFLPCLEQSEDLTTRVSHYLLREIICKLFNNWYSRTSVIQNVDPIVHHKRQWQGEMPAQPLAPPGRADEWLPLWGEWHSLPLPFVASLLRPVFVISLFRCFPYADFM